MTLIGFIMYWVCWGLTFEAVMDIGKNWNNRKVYAAILAFLGPITLSVIAGISLWGVFKGN